VEGKLRLAAQIRPTGSYLGVKLGDVDADRAGALKLGDERGAEVKDVEQGSPAESAGIKSGDVLLTYNGENILGAQQLVRLVQETPQGRKVKIQLWRDGKTQTVVATTAAPPVFSPLTGIPVPDFNPWYPTDTPRPLMIWKNSLLGIECEPLDSQLAQYFGVKNGVLLRSVDKDSAAGKAGLKAGVVLTTIGERTLASPRDFISYMRTLRPSASSISVVVVREHKELRFKVPPLENPQ
jgi:serine protease Do